MDIKIIFTDLDRTLLNRDSKISARSLEAIRHCREAGIHFVPVTGRTSTNIAFIREIPFIPYVLCCNGARCIDNQTGKTLFFSGLEYSAASDALRVLSEFRCNRRVFADEQVCGDGVEVIYSPGNGVDCDALPRFCTEHAAGIEKLDIVFSDPEIRRLAWEKLKTVQGVKLSAAFETNLEINGMQGDKGSGIIRLSETLGIAREHTMAFGDGINDISMLSAAGTAVAMENAEPELKAVADLIAPPHWDDGEAAVIEKYVLNVRHNS